MSYMLSHGSGEPSMSHPDYEQQAHHHSCLLILIRGIGQSKPRSLQKIFERIQQVNNVKIKGTANTDPKFNENCIHSVNHVLMSDLCFFNYFFQIQQGTRETFGFDMYEIIL